MIGLAFSLNKISKYFTYFIDLLYPDLCVGCKSRLFENEKYLCLYCHTQLPFSNSVYQKNNNVLQTFDGRAVITTAYSYLNFSKQSITQNLMHDIKYNGNKELAKSLGTLLGNFLKLNNISYENALLIPVPLHPKKLKKRGFNQSEWIAKGVGESLEIDISTNHLIKTVNTSSQTKKNKTERWNNVKDSFTVVQPELLEGKNIIMVDDVLTTGATLEACISTLKSKVNQTNFHIITLAHVN